jgi:hypothetical protein
MRSKGRVGSTGLGVYLIKYDPVIQTSMPIGLCRLQGTAVVGGGLLSRVEQLSHSETVSPGDRPGLCDDILGVLRNVEGGCRNVVSGEKRSNHQRTNAISTAWCLFGPTQVGFGIRAPPPPILGGFGQVESGFWGILLV